MKPYTKILYNFFGYDISDRPICENCGAESVDTMHLWPKGKYPELKNDIFNLMAGCRNCHETLSNEKEMLLKKHIDFMLKHQPKKTMAALGRMDKSHTLYEKIEEILLDQIEIHLKKL